MEETYKRPSPGAVLQPTSHFEVWYESHTSSIPPVADPMKEMAMQIQVVCVKLTKLRPLSHISQLNPNG